MTAAPTLIASILFEEAFYIGCTVDGTLWDWEQPLNGGHCSISRSKNLRTYQSGSGRASDGLPPSSARTLARGTAYQDQLMLTRAGFGLGGSRIPCGPERIYIFQGSSQVSLRKFRLCPHTAPARECTSARLSVVEAGLQKGACRYVISASPVLIEQVGPLIARILLEKSFLPLGSVDNIFRNGEESPDDIRLRLITPRTVREVVEPDLDRS